MPRSGVRRGFERSFRRSYAGPLTPSSKVKRELDAYSPIASSPFASSPFALTSSAAHRPPCQRMAANEEETDRQLATRWQAGDERAATLLVQRHASALARFAASLGLRDDVDEVVQDTFVR